MKFIKFLTTTLIFTSVLSVASFVQAKDFTIDDSMGSVSVHIEHEVGFNTGVFQKFSGTLSYSDDLSKVTAFDLVIDAASLQTFNDDKDEYLKTEEFLNVKQFPTITIKSKKIGKDSVSAEVTILGKTKKINFEFHNYGIQKNKSGQSVAIAVFQGVINRRDFGIDYNVRSRKTNKELLGYEINLIVHLNAK